MNITGNESVENAIHGNFTGDSCETETKSAGERVANIIGYAVIILVSLIGNTLLICTVTEEQPTQHDNLSPHNKHGCRRYFGHGLQYAW